MKIKLLPYIYFSLSLMLTGCANQESPKEVSSTMMPPSATVTGTPTENIDNVSTLPTDFTYSSSTIADTTQDPVYLEETDISYETVTFTDSIQLVCKQGTGWSIDLNNDGNLEQLYGNTNGIFINDILVIPVENAFDTDFFDENIFWLLNIDTEDGFYEVLTYRNLQYDLWYYDEQGNFKQINHDVCGWFNLFAEYDKAKDIRRPIRIDAHTIAFQDRHFVFDSYSMTASYQLNDRHELTLVPQAYEIEYPSRIDYINEDVPLKLYSTPSLESTYTETIAPQTYTLTQSDGCSWIYLESSIGEAGWIYVEYNADGEALINGELLKEDFTGYSNVP